MKTKLIRRTLGCILAVILLLQASPYAFAHSTSQEGILAKTYIEAYGRYYIGGDSVGWSIDETAHTNGTTLTYSFSATDPYLTTAYKAYVTGGANRWNGTVSITNKTDGSGTGLISTYYEQNSNTVAMFCNFESNSSGHLTSWEIRMNRYHPQSTTVLAHELGHAIGLNDLYASTSADKLMYGYTNGTATGPTDSDKWGAKVITGVHSVHSWSYKYYGTTNNGGNKHIKYCKDCNGLSITIASCTYNSQNICILCGVPYGVQPWSLGHETE